MRIQTTVFAPGKFMLCSCFYMLFLLVYLVITVGIAQRLHGHYFHWC